MQFKYAGCSRISTDSIKCCKICTYILPPTISSRPSASSLTVTLSRVNPVIIHMYAELQMKERGCYLRPRSLARYIDDILLRDGV